MALITYAVAATALQQQQQQQLAPDPVASLRARLLGQLLPTAAALPGAIKHAEASLRTMGANGSWPDINYGDTSHGAHDHWQPSAHLGRVKSMAAPLVACSLTPNKLCNSSAMRVGSIAGLRFWLTINPSSENWFFNQISAPQDLAQLLLLLQHGGFLAARELADADVDVRRGADWWRGWSGMNLVDLATLQIYRGLLLGREALVAEGFAAVFEQLRYMPWPPPQPSEIAAARCNSSAAATVPCLPSSCQVGGGSYLGDGIQVDGSFHQHGAELLSGAYGAALTNIITSFIPLGQGTKWAVSAEQLAVFAAVVLDGQARMTLPGAVWDFAVCGRGCVDSSGSSGPRDSISTAGLRFAATLYAAGSATARRFSAFAHQLEGEQTAAEAARGLGTFSYYRSDYLLHRRPGWSASWKGRSNRTLPSRCVNHDDKMGADSGEGATLVYRSDSVGSEMAGIWPVIDWQQYPGVTVQQGDLATCAWHYAYDHEPTFVSSVADESGGAVAQLLQHHNISGQRSWSFGDGGVTTLVTDLRRTCTNKGQPTCSQNATLTTIVNARLAGTAFLRIGSGAAVRQLEEGHEAAVNSTFEVSDGDAAVVWHNHTCYVVRSPSRARFNLQVQVGKLVGDLYRISALPKAASASIFRLSAEHSQVSGGKHANDSNVQLADVTYTVLPNGAKQACFGLEPLAPAGVGVSAVAASAKNGTCCAAHVFTNATAATASVVVWPDAKETKGLVVPLELGGRKLGLKVSSGGAGCLLQLRLAKSKLMVSASNPELGGATVHIDPSINDERPHFPNTKGCELQLPSGEHAGKTVSCALDLMTLGAAAATAAPLPPGAVLTVSQKGTTPWV